MLVWLSRNRTTEMIKSEHRTVSLFVLKCKISHDEWQERIEQKFNQLRLFFLTGFCLLNNRGTRNEHLSHSSMKICSLKQRFQTWLSQVALGGQVVVANKLTGELQSLLVQHLITMCQYLQVTYCRHLDLLARKLSAVSSKS